MDPKTDIIRPIDFFIVSQATDDTSQEKFQFFKRSCNNYIDLARSKKDYRVNHTLKAAKDSIAIKCTSSGTTDTPKKVEHTHEFIKAIASRNSKLYYGNVALAYNLNHGSSIATYFLPALMEDRVKEFYNITNFSDDPIAMYPDKPIDHLMISYTDKVEEFASSNIKISKSKKANNKNKLGGVFPIEYTDNKQHKKKNLTVYTLGPIPANRQVQSAFKDIISFFGSNETSGPTLINQLSRTDFQIEKYVPLDDFYDFWLSNDILQIDMPIYNKTHNSQDRFKIENNAFIFLGRDDMYRINGIEVDKEALDFTVDLHTSSRYQIVYDTVRSQIYLACWGRQKNIQKCVKRINKEVPKYHNITKAAELDKKEFISGVKIDQELLREYFRRYC